MTDTAGESLAGREPSTTDDQALLPAVVAAVRAAGDHVAGRFSADARIGSIEQLIGAIHANDDASLSVLRDGLTLARPSAGWIEDEEDGGMLPPGEWWVVDPVEGNINYIHGMTEWGVTATLVRDNVAVVAVVYVPLKDELYSAVLGGGAYLSGRRLVASAKTELRGALVGTAQGKPDEDSETYDRIGQSVTAMMRGALVVRVLVPATLQLVEVAAGRMDAFWQYGQVRVGLLPGALLVTEAGGRVSDSLGRPWTPESTSFLAAAPDLHRSAATILSTIA